MGKDTEGDIVPKHLPSFWQVNTNCDLTAADVSAVSTLFHSGEKQS